MSLVTAREPKTVNRDQLCQELHALDLPGVRDFTIIGEGDYCTGVYCWDDSAPPGEFTELDLNAARTRKVRDAIESHVPATPTPAPTLAEQLAAAIQAAASLDDLKAKAAALLSDPGPTSDEPITP